MRNHLLAIVSIAIGAAQAAFADEPVKPAAPIPPAASPFLAAVEPATAACCPPAQSCNTGGSACGSIFTPFMLGDFIGPLANLFSDVKIAEGESPEPMDRVFMRTHYYNNLNKSRWQSPIEPIHNVDLLRNTFGFEKAFADQSISFGLRIPFNTLNADGKPFHLQPDPNLGILVPSFEDKGFDTTLLGNISAILKSVAWEDRQGGDLISVGATLSFPTASNRKIDPGMSTMLFIQPFGGYIFNRGDMFVQGFSSLTLPIAHAESVVMFNDVGVGYWLMRNRSGLISGLVPTIELHVATPIRQVDPNDVVFGPFDGFRIFNVVNVTAGTTVLLSNNSTLALGMVVPMTGPKPFDVEVLSQFNYRF